MISLKISKLITSLALCIVLSLCIVRPSFADGCLQRNPPGSTQGEASSPCGCSITGKDVVSVGNDCIKIVLGMGETMPWTGSRDLALKVFADDASQMLFTPDSLYAIAGYTFKRIGNAVMEDGETPKEVVFSHPNGEGVKFVFNEGESLARPDPNVHIPMDERLQMVDAQGWATTKNPIYWDLYLGDGRVRRYVATPEFNERGRFVSERDARGRVITAEEMGIDVVYDMSGIRQFLTPSRLADVKSFVEGYEVKIYVLQDAPKKEASSGLYPVPNTKPYRVLTVKREDDDYRAVVTVKTGDQEAKKYIFNYAMGDWELIRPNGVKEVKDRMIAEEIAARLSKAVISASGKLMSKAVMTYKYESWGYAMTNKVDGFDGVERNTSWTYFTSGGGKGKLKTSLEHSGLLTTYAYDEQGRKISEKRSGPDMMTEVTTYAYAPVDPSDPALPVDTRPRTIVKTLNGIECERTYYVYAPLTNIVERVGTQGAAYGGTNVLRTVVAYYPVAANDLRSGRVKSRRHEDGKLDIYDYSLNDGIWTEMVTHVHEQSPEPISGKTTRDITLTNARGEVIETRKEAFIDGVWHTIARERLTYNAEGKRIKSENLAGQVTTTAWDCCHKISEVQPDGSTTMWDYDDEGRIIASSRLIPMDMTNVTWLTTCYEYDDLGRQTATWQTNHSAKVGLPVSRTRYDQLGRVIARVDQLGNTTTTSYSNDGRTVSVQNPNTSTRVTTRSANGDTISITGSAVTPEFHTYGILPNGTRWTRIVQGETASSPRFTKRYENMLGQVVKEERSGFKGVVLATTHTYDSLGRLVSTVADYEPMVEYEFNNIGENISSTKCVTSGEWRRESISERFELRGTNVWHVMNTVLVSSDVTIPALVLSSSDCVTGLTLNKVAQSTNVDVRGNVYETRTEYDGCVIKKSIVSPAQTINVESYYRNGVLIRFKSESGVERRVVFDGLGRPILSLDGRGKETHTEYDARGLQISTVDANGYRLMCAYNQFGELVAVTNAVGDVVSYGYDIRGRKVYEGGATYPVRYAYDVYGNLVSMTTYRNEGVLVEDVTQYLYDESSGMVTNKIYADGKGVSYNYDSYARPVKRTLARGIETTYAYNDWGLRVRTDYSDSTPSVVISYDAFGRLIKAFDAAGVTTFAYDCFGANTNETVIGIAGTNTIERYFDNFGRNIGYSLNGVRQSLLAYDQKTGQTASMRVNGSDTPFVWNYLDGSDLKSSLSYPNGLTASWQYDANGQLLQVRNATPTDVISQYDYIYDAAGRRISCAKSGSAFTQDDTVAYGYNNRSELTNAVAEVDSNYRYAYDFDDIGNREASSEGGTNSVYIANQLNQYTAVDDFTPEFDDDGNQTLIKTATGIWQVTYNGENRPILWENVSTNSHTPNSSTPTLISMSYDRMGRRVAKNNQRFVYNGHQQIACCNQSQINNHFFVWDPTEPVTTRPLAWNCGGTVVYYTYDGNKNVSEIVTQIGVVDAHYGYTPFGAVTTQRGGCSVTNPWRFSSEYSDDDLAMTYYNFRHYDPIAGRWMSRDLIEEMGGVGLYCFLSNNPLGTIDILGLTKKKKIECDKEHVGVIRAIDTTMLSVAGEAPDALDNKLNLIIALLLFYDIPLPGKDDLSSIALAQYNTMLSKYPGGADVAAEIIKNRNKLKDVLSRNSNKDVWSKVECQRCECSNPILSLIGLAQPDYSWKTVDQSEWIKCDILETKWGRRAVRWRYSPVEKDGTLSPLLSSKDKKAVIEQCGEQARKYCESWMDN